MLLIHILFLLYLKDIDYIGIYYNNILNTNVKDSRYMSLYRKLNYPQEYLFYIPILTLLSLEVYILNLSTNLFLGRLFLEETTNDNIELRY